MSLRSKTWTMKSCKKRWKLVSSIIKMAHLDLKRWMENLRNDRDQLHLLELSAREVTPERDAKLAEIKRLIAEKAKHPTEDNFNRPNRKVLVFTAFADTAVYLYNQLQPWAWRELGIHVAMVSGGSAENKTTFGKNEFNQILTNFSPCAKNRAKMHGPAPGRGDRPADRHRLHLRGPEPPGLRHLINYDIHWNPVRIIQRFGRIDRIGIPTPRCSWSISGPPRPE